VWRAEVEFWELVRCQPTMTLDNGTPVEILREPSRGGGLRVDSAQEDQRDHMVIGGHLRRQSSVPRSDELSDREWRDRFDRQSSLLAKFPFEGRTEGLSMFDVSSRQIEPRFARRATRFVFSFEKEVLSVVFNNCTAGQCGFATSLSNHRYSSCWKDLARSVSGRRENWEIGQSGEDWRSKVGAFDSIGCFDSAGCGILIGPKPAASLAAIPERRFRCEEP